jgi:LysM repeat protein
VIVPVELINVEGLPSFDAYMVVDNGTTIESVAASQKVDASILKLYNGLEAGYLFSAGEWVLIPHPRT